MDSRKNAFVSDFEQSPIVIICDQLMSKIQQKKKQSRGNNFAMLHDVELPKPCLVKRVASSMYDVTKSILFCQHEHRVEETLHCIRRLYKRRPGEIDSCINNYSPSWRTFGKNTHSL
jgi:hypothetical protein